jgi:ABC-type multidrug transport system fused ATPase/permease subunit
MLNQLRYFRGYRLGLLVAALLGLIATIAETAAIVLVVPLAASLVDPGQGVDRTVGPFDITLGAGAAAVLILALIVLATALQLGTVALRARLATSWERRTRNRLFGAFAAADYETQSGQRPGHLQQGMNFAETGSRSLSELMSLVASGTSLLLLLVAAFVLSPITAVGVAVFGAVISAALRPLRKGAKASSRRTGRATMTLGSDVSQVERLIADIDLFGIRQPVTEQLDAASRKVARHRGRTMMLVGSVGPTYRNAGLVFLVGILALIGATDAIDPVTAGAVALLLLRGMGYGQQLQRAYATILEGEAKLEILHGIIDHFERRRAVHGDVRLAIEPLSIELRGVSYEYADGTAALHDLDLRIAPGERIGIVGASGGGKTTLASILTRLRQPTAGVYLVNGRAASEYRPEDWARAVALVPQHPILLHGSLSENIRFFRTWVTDDEVAAAAERAGLSELIAGLPDGLATAIGPDARSLSGGQVQRVGIARALAGDPRLLILDEPTSALDPGTERALQETMSALPEGITLVLIAHRLSTLAVCDRVIVIDNGRLSDDGPTDRVLSSHSAGFRKAD